jgi:hypothetical protein
MGVDREVDLRWDKGGGPPMSRTKGSQGRGQVLKYRILKNK